MTPTGHLIVYALGLAGAVGLVAGFVLGLWAMSVASRYEVRFSLLPRRDGGGEEADDAARLESIAEAHGLRLPSTPSPRRS